MRLGAADDIRSRVEEFLAEAAAKTGVTVERIVAELAKIAFSDVRNALDWGMKETEQGSIQYGRPWLSCPKVMPPRSHSVEP